MNKIKFGIFALFLGISLALMGCETTTGVVSPSDDEDSMSQTDSMDQQSRMADADKKAAEEEMTAKVAAPAEEPEPEPEKIYELQTVYFKFDNSDIQDQFKQIIEENYEWLKDNPEVKIQLEGHADERGTNEYNLALGERRGKSVLNYLIALGADPEQFTIISFGEERPVEPGHSEMSWAQNRRVVFTRL
ncbi:MAG: peptidoglycan-associated lipoprotein Pal [SAR324 cluster bacterium]|nr:peptidoglycan-associated lipoprotein Pal [SAR324 cluster bacterium]